jgi:hypothetical protein
MTSSSTCRVRSSMSRWEDMNDQPLPMRMTHAKKSRPRIAVKLLAMRHSLKQQQDGKTSQ